VQLGPREQVLRPDSLNGSIAQFELADGLTKKRGLARLGLDHQQTERRDRDLQGNRGRPTSRTDIEQARVRAEMGPVSVGASEMARHNERLDEQAVNRLVWSILQREGSKIDLLVPELEQAVVGR